MDTPVTDWKALSPVTLGGRWSYKREDLFSPFGAGGVNGSKLRQVYHLCETAVSRGHTGIVSGAVKDSPQHPMVTRIAKVYGLTSTCVVGVKRVEEHPMLGMAARYGASFVYSRVGYAATLNAIARRTAEERNLFHLETNITVSGSPERLLAFHDIGGQQVRNIPDDTEALLVPAGSCNSATSVLYGLAAHGAAPKLREVVLFGIGAEGSRLPSHIPDRLEKIGRASGVDYGSLFDFDLTRPPAEARRETDGRVKVIRYDLNGAGFCRYSDWMPYEADSIAFHPRYEGKILNYIDANEGEFSRYEGGRTCFWIVGSEPGRVAVA